VRIVLVAVILLTVVPAARADVATARKAYEKGMTSYNLQHFADALGMFQRAYEEKSDPAFLFNIGQCQRQVGEYDAAAKSYRAYLNTSPVPPPNAVQVRELIAEMDAAAQKKLASVPPTGTITPSPSSPAAQPTIAVTASPPERKASVWKKPLTWSIIGGVVVVGLAVGLGVGLGTRSTTPTASTPLGTASPF
jgi:hypothetical protein